jgi:parallel beta-helix repeat protein
LTSVIILWWFIADNQVWKERSYADFEQFQDLEKEFQNLFLLAEDSQTITLPAGYFKFTKSLILDGKNHITIKGAGIDKTILSFREQTDGAEGIKIANATNITLDGFTIQDAKGDNIKMHQIDTLNCLNIKSEWTHSPHPTNGAYAIYPVLCKDVLIEGCIAARSSDAGIYVGQSEDVIIRNNKAYENVSGFNIENTTNIELYDNEAFNNTVGIHIIELPGLLTYGKNAKVHHNKVYENNLDNFAPKGNIAAESPAGTGIMLFGSKNTEVFENDIKNQPLPLIVASYLVMLGNENEAAANEVTHERNIEEGESQLGLSVNNENYKKDKNFDPYPFGIHIHDNTYAFGAFRKLFKSEIGTLIGFKYFLTPPDIIFDGHLKPGLKGKEILCIDEKTKPIFVNADIPSNMSNISTDMSNFDCSTNQ